MVFERYQSVSRLFSKSLRENWDRPAISNFHGMTYSYGDLAVKIARMHVIFDYCGLKKGDRVAICGKNQANWALSFLAAFTYGAVPVPLLHEFTSANIHFLVNHSEARLFFVDDQIWSALDGSEIPDVEAVIGIKAFTPLLLRNGKAGYAIEHVDDLMVAKYPDGFGPSQTEYDEADPEDLALINYTSGTSGFSKGVMLTHASFWSNMDFGFHIETGYDNRSTHVAILPSAHMYGLMFELMYQALFGVHIHYLNRIPSPKIIMQALGEVRPKLVITVPLVIEKIYRNNLKPVLDKPVVKLLCRWVPGFERVFLSRMRRQLLDAFGGNLVEVIIGGAAFNREVEAFFRKMKFPYTVGYGMTECGPIITYSHFDKAKFGASGTAAPNMEIRVDSEDPRRVLGEIQCRGANVFKGYFKNEENTAQAFTSDGWLRTGDMGIIDSDGFLFIKGRSKCMILGANGQNIYPEELEAVVNNIPFVNDSLVIDDHGIITALVYPDFRGASEHGLDEDALKASIEKHLASADIPAYAKVKKVEILQQDFERTPKKSIKRYLYQR